LSWIPLTNEVMTPRVIASVSTVQCVALLWIFTHLSGLNIGDIIIIYSPVDDEDVKKKGNCSGTVARMIATIGLTIVLAAGSTLGGLEVI
jgi:hypothetical protein